MIYFQGTDTTLWRLNPDGTGGTKVAGLKSLSKPVVYGNFVYFQGIDYKLCQCNLDGSNLTVVGGGNTTWASPFVCATGVYFRGVNDNKLWRINLDGTGQVNLGGYKCSSTPYVIGQYVFFQGTDNKLWRILIDGTAGSNIGQFQSKSAPFANMRYVFFQGTDDKLWRCNFDGTEGVNLAGYKCSSTPFVTDTHVYFQGTDNKLWQINIDGTDGVNLGGYKCASSPTVDTSQNFVYFQGTDNALWRINMDGSGGTHLGGFDTWSTPFVVQPANQPQTGDLTLRYIPLLLVYSPPGSSTGVDCQVEYTTGSTAGTTVSINDSFNWGLGISAGGGSAGSGSGGTGSGAGAGSGSGGTGSTGGSSGGTGGSGGSGGSGSGASSGPSFGIAYSNSTSDTSTLDIKKSTTYDLKVPGPKTDGIDHSQDLLYVMLTPALNIVVDPNYNLNWGLDFEAGSGGVVVFKMAWLKNLTLMAQENPDLKRRCDTAGMTANDYTQLLSLNPFANGPAAIDPNRYLLTNIFLTYEADILAPETETLANTVTYTTIHANQQTLGISGSTPIPILNNLLKVSGSVGWSMSTTTTATNISSQTASVTFGGPAPGYTGSENILVYTDTLFNTFMFAAAAEAPSVTGTFLNPTTKLPAPNVKVQLTVGKQIYYATTDSKGVYRFYGTGKGTVTQVPQKKITTGILTGLKTVTGKEEVLTHS